MKRFAFAILLLLVLALAGLELAASRLEPATRPIEAATDVRAAP
jgi:hypothetical protein